MCQLDAFKGNLYIYQNKKIYLTANILPLNRKLKSFQNSLSEYAEAGVPMLPVVAGKDATRRQILIYTILLVPVSFAPLALGIAGYVYAICAIAMGGGLLFLAYRIITRRDDHAARRMFQYSIIYLFVLFLALIAERLWEMAFAPIY